jgi:hypothetical protein
MGISLEKITNYENLEIRVSKDWWLVAASVGLGEPARTLVSNPV